MSVKGTRLPRLAASTAIALFALSGHAQAADFDAVLSRTSASLSNLRFQLIDLTPDDGVGPSVTFNSLAVLDGTQLFAIDDLGVTQSYSGPSYANSWLPTPGFNLTNGTGVTTSTTGNSITLSSQLTWGDLSNNLQSVPNYRNGTAQTYGGAVLAHPDLSSLGTFTLGANSLLVVSGTATVNTQLDFSSLAPGQANAQEPYETSTLTRSGFANIIVGMGDDVLVGNFFEDINGRIDLANTLDLTAGNNGDTVIDLNAGFDQATRDIYSSKNFTFSLGNSSDAESTHTLGWMLNVNDTLTLNQYTLSTETPIIDPIDPTLPPIPGNVPEPGTWAMMGLGLVGLAWMRRRNAR